MQFNVKHANEKNSSEQVLVVGSQNGERIAKALAQINGDVKIKEVLSDEEMVVRGWVKGSSGEWLERSKVCFLLQGDPKDENVLHGMRGELYLRTIKGVLRKVGEKSKEQRKAEKKAISQYWANVRLQNKTKSEPTAQAQ